MYHLENRLALTLRSAIRSQEHVRSYSKKSGNSKSLTSYKIVGSDNVVDDLADPRFDDSPNWQLFGKRGHRFLLPGSIGPAWHESGSMVPVDRYNKPCKKISPIDLETLECTAQECPVLLRKGIKELFPGIEAAGAHALTVVSLRRKNAIKPKRKIDKDAEHHAKTFMWAAQEICVRLKMAGYWADFINPFSGRPYLSPFQKDALYETDERFRCIGFEISSDGVCKIIQPNNGDGFIGSLFTDAPASTDFLMDLLSH